MAWDGSFDFDRSAEFFNARGDGERMQALHVARAFLGPGQNIQGAGVTVDNRSRSDADLGLYEGALDGLSRNGGDAAAGVQETSSPERRGRAPGGIEGIDAIVLGGGKYHVVLSVAGNLDARQIKRLGVDIAVHSKREQLSEAGRIDTGGSERGFVEIGSGAGTIVLGSGNLREGEPGGQKRKDRKGGERGPSDHFDIRRGTRFIVPARRTFGGRSHIPATLSDETRVGKTVANLGPDPEDVVVQQAQDDGELHKALLDHLEAGIYMVDRKRRIVYWNRGAEQISGYLAQEVAGHFCQGDLLMHCDSAGVGICGKGCPLSSVMLDGKPHETTLFLRHRHGHRVPVHIRSRAIYDSTGAITGAVEVFEQVSAPAVIDRRGLEEHGCLDPLAEVPNRSYGEFKLGQSLAVFRKFGIAFGWLTVEIDEVEKLEHRYGHGMVDAAVKMLARTLDSNLGPLDSLTRWERAEFRIEVHNPGGHRLDGLMAKLGVLARASNLEWWGDPVRVTVSIAGVMVEPEDTPALLETRLAAALAKSRAERGNRTGGGRPSGDFQILGDQPCLP
jgi:diguanylate cyclase (GGDEF)-like protein